MKIELEVRGLGHVPSFKNNKRAIWDHFNGKMRTLTEPKTKKWMQRCEDSFVSQFYSRLAIDAAAMLTEQPPHSLTVWLLPLDDSRQVIPELHIYCEEVEKGNEGAVIIVEPL